MAKVKKSPQFGGFFDTLSIKNYPKNIELSKKLVNIAIYVLIFFNLFCILI